MTALPGDRQTTACTGCGVIYWRDQVHHCDAARRVSLPTDYVDRQWPYLLAQLEPVVTFPPRPARHARPMSGADLLAEHARLALGDYVPRHGSAGRQP